MEALTGADVERSVEVDQLSKQEHELMMEGSASNNQGLGVSDLGTWRSPSSVSQTCHLPSWDGPEAE